MKRPSAPLLAMLLVGAALAPVAAAHATTTHKPVVVSVAAAPNTVPAAGGTIRLVIKDKHAKTCKITALPKLAGLPKTVSCAAGVASVAIKIPANTTANSKTIRFQVVAQAPGGKSASRAASVTEATDMGPVGATLDVQNLSGATLAVTMTQIVDPATGANEFYTPNAGDRFVAVEMTLQNPGTATVNDNANSDTTVIGTDSQAYTADFDSVAECTNFSFGEFTMLPGGSEAGCVVFQLPVGVNVKAIQFIFGGNSADVAQWTP
jgi:hypothetical protein